MNIIGPFNLVITFSQRQQSFQRSLTIEMRFLQEVQIAREPQEAESDPMSNAQVSNSRPGGGREGPPHHFMWPAKKTNRLP